MKLEIRLDYSTHIALIYLCGDIHACFGWNKKRGWGAIKEGICLALLISLLYTITEFLQIEFCLYINMLASLNWIGRAWAKLVLSSLAGNCSAAVLLLPLNFNGVRLGCLKLFKYQKNKLTIL